MKERLLNLLDFWFSDFQWYRDIHRNDNKQWYKITTDRETYWVRRPQEFFDRLQLIQKAYDIAVILHAHYNVNCVDDMAQVILLVTTGDIDGANVIIRNLEDRLLEHYQQFSETF